MKFSQHLKELRQEIFEYAFDPDICGFATINDLATTAGLSWQTVENLYRGVTKEPRHSTMWKLCVATGMDIALKEAAKEKSRVR